MSAGPFEAKPVVIVQRRPVKESDRLVPARRSGMSGTFGEPRPSLRLRYPKGPAIWLAHGKLSA